MKLHFKFYWGFDPVRQPAVTFANEASRNSLVKKAQTGDHLVYLTPHSKEVAEEERGKVLGMVQFTLEPKETLELVRRENVFSRNWNKDGTHRFPLALPVIRAWKFSAPFPLIGKITERKPSRAWGQWVQTFSEAESATLLNYSFVELPLEKTAEGKKITEDFIQRKRAEELHAELVYRPGPPPISGTRLITVREKDWGFVYVFRYGTLDVWKVGFSSNPPNRLVSFNATVPHPHSVYQWEPYNQHPLPSPEAAYTLEKLLHHKLEGYWIKNEMFHCSEAILSEVWDEAMINKGL